MKSLFAAVALVVSKPVPASTTESYGCSVKYKSQSRAREALESRTDAGARWGTFHLAPTLALRTGIS